jgi:hypothetical protein
VAAAAAMAVAGLGALTTDLDDWYYQLAQPAWKPPDWMFGPAWTTIFALGHNFKISALTSSRPGPITAISVSTPASCTIMITCPIIERFAISCKTFGVSDFIRVPSPAARMIAAQDRANDDEPESLETIENQLVVTGMIRLFRL